MKRWEIIIWLEIAIGLVWIGTHTGWSCPQGTIEWNDSCAQEIKPEGTEQTVQPSNEKPPDDKMPSYEREGIKVIDIRPQMTVDDEIKAAQEQGERMKQKAAGIK